MILVVDDDPTVVETLQTCLQNAGYDVKTAPDGAQAYGMAASPDCECIILDINMPTFNGPALLVVLQSEGRHVPVIVMTGEPGFSQEEMGQFANVVAFLEKPMEMSELLEKVRTHARTSS